MKKLRQGWAKEEEDFLIENFCKHGVSFCEKKLKRSKSSIRHKAYKLKLGTHNFWKLEEDKFLFENYLEKGAVFCSKKLNRTIPSISSRIKYLNLQTKTVKKWTRDEENFLIENYIKMGEEYCFSMLTRSPQQILQRVFKLGIKTRKSAKRWSNDEIQFLKDNYFLKGTVFCAKKLNRQEQAVRQKASLLDIKQKRKEIDHESFIKMDTPEAAYIAGFLWADGTLSKNRPRTFFGIKTEDILKIKHLFEKFGEWNEIVRNRNGRKQLTVLSTCNKNIYNFFASMDYREKSLVEPTKILNYISPNLRHYWWRGFIDGDGCWFHSKYSKSISMAGQVSYQWEESIKLFLFLKIEKYKIYRRQKQFSDRIGGNSNIRIENYKEILILGEYVYNNYEEDKIGLPRKFEKFKNIKDQFLN